MVPGRCFVTPVLVSVCSDGKGEVYSNAQMEKVKSTVNCLLVL